MKKKKKLVINFICSIIIGIITVFLLQNFEIITNNYKIFSYSYKNNFDSGEIELTKGEINGYEIDGKIITSVEFDPNISFYDFNKKIYNLKIELENVTQPFNFKIYYDTNGTGFNEKNTKSIFVNESESPQTLSILLDQKETIKNIRFDIGDDKGLQLNNISISINKGIISLNEMLEKTFTSINIERMFLISIFTFFIGLHFIYSSKKIYAFLFDKRYIVGIIVFIFLNLMNYHTSSVGIYDQIIQPGLGSEYIEPIFGNPRPIRSDEFIVRTPAKLSRDYIDRFSKNNTILRGTDSVDTPLTKITTDISLLTNPFNIGFILFGSTIGYGFETFGRIIATFLVGIEFFMIFTKKNKLLSVTGSVLVTFSSYIFWWNIYWVCPLMGIITCIYHFLNQNDENKVKKFMLTIGFSIFSSAFVCVLYPASQVPAAYVIISILIWGLINYWDKIRSLDKSDWLMFLFGIGLFLLITCVYMYDLKDYTKVIMNTTYPGHRVDTGGLSIQKIFNYVLSLYLPFNNNLNQSEISTFFSLFPLPIILALIVWFKNKDKKDILLYLLAVSFMLTIYCTIGFPEILAKITLMSYTTSLRCIDVLSLVQVFLLIISLSRVERVTFLNKRYALIISITISIISCIICKNCYNTVSSWYYLLMALIIFILCYTMIMSNSIQMTKFYCIFIIVISLISTMSIHPIMKGFDVIKSKPLYQEIQKIQKEEPNAKWIAYNSLHLPGFLVSSGASTYNFANYYPNMEFWEKIDKNKKYIDEYNRYAHIVIEFIEDETKVELLQQDAIKLLLNFNDIKKIGVDYICSLQPLENNSNYNLVYNESNAYIYKVKK